MADLPSALKTLLNGDATLIAITGWNGALDDDDVGYEGLTSEYLRGDAPLVLPTIYIHWTSEGPMRGPKLPIHAVSGDEAEQHFVEIYFYDDRAYANIETMRLRVKKLLHQQTIAIDTDYVMAFIWSGDVKRQRDERLSGVKMERSRYEIHYMRRYT